MGQIKKYSFSVVAGIITGYCLAEIIILMMEVFN